MNSTNRLIESSGVYDGSQMIRYDVRDTIAWVTLSRPEKLNAMTRGFWKQLRDTLDAADRDPAVRAAVIHGDGRCFSVGGDIQGFGELADDADRHAYIEEAVGALLAVEAARTPTIAAVHGHALGGGCELTFVCDLVVADETARFGLPEASVGLIPGLGILRARAHVNLHWLKYMILTGRTLDAQQAYLAGLVQAVVPAGEHVAEAERWAQDVSRRSPTAVSAAKAFLGRDARERFEESVAVVAALQGGEDLAEGVAAFAEGRTPEFARR